MLDLPLLVSHLKLSDSIVCWEPLPHDFDIMGQFSADDWRRIFPFIRSKQQWCDYLDSMSRISTVRVLRSLTDGKLYGFVFLSLHNYTGRSIIFHGGGWGKSVFATLMYYRGLTLLLDQILKQGCKVVTSWDRSNTVAERFLRSVGFVAYAYSSTHTFAWINSKRLSQSPLTLQKRRPSPQLGR